MRLFALSAVVLALLAVPTTASAAPQDQANDLSGEIMSPFCPGVTLHECPSAEAIELRDKIVEWFALGQTRSEIMRKLEDEYGTGIRAAPPVGGAGLGAWLLPAIALGLGIGLAAFLLRRWTRAPEPVTTETTKIGGSLAERKRLDSELAAMRGPR